MQRDLSSYRLSSVQLNQLKSNGFVFAEDVKILTPVELSEELKVTAEEALDILQIVRDDVQSINKSAYEMLKEEELETPIVTFCAALDNMIGGGIALGKITEICGAPGIGKTQLGIQLAVDTQIPEPFGGVGGEAVYIDCEGSFICERVIEIASAASKHLESVAEIDNDAEQKKIYNEFNVETILNGIHVYRCHGYIQLIALSYILPDFLEEHPNVKLIVLDSIAVHFRHDFEDMGLRTRMLHGLVQRFMKMANDNKLAVVFMNQMTTKISQDGGSKLIPALGQSWGHACTTRIILDSVEGQRYARLFKSPNCREAAIMFDITKDGIRDVDIHIPNESMNKSNASVNEHHVVPNNTGSEHHVTNSTGLQNQQPEMYNKRQRLER